MAQATYYLSDDAHPVFTNYKTLVESGASSGGLTADSDSVKARIVVFDSGGNLVAYSDWASFTTDSSSFTPVTQTVSLDYTGGGAYYGVEIQYSSAGDTETVHFLTTSVVSWGITGTHAITLYMRFREIESIGGVIDLNDVEWGPDYPSSISFTQYEPEYDYTAALAGAAAPLVKAAANIEFGALIAGSASTSLAVSSSVELGASIAGNASESVLAGKVRVFASATGASSTASAVAGKVYWEDAGVGYAAEASFKTGVSASLGASIGGGVEALYELVATVLLAAALASGVDILSSARGFGCGRIVFSQGKSPLTYFLKARVGAGSSAEKS